MGLVYVIVKYSLFIINSCFTLASIALIVIGAISIKRDLFQGFEDDSLEETFESIAIGIIAFGCVVFMFAFSGSIGAIMEINNILITFIVLMSFIVTAEIYLVIVWEKDINFIKNEMIASLNKIFDDPGDNSTFPYLEASLHCCGITGPDSYHYEELPQSCCADEVLNVENICLLENAYSEGCVEIIQNLIRGMKNNLKTLLYCVIAFQLAGIALIVFGAISANHDLLKGFADDSLEDILEAIAIGIVAFGCVVLLFAFSGCIGAIMEINNILITFIVLMSFLVTAEIYSVIVWEKDINFIKNGIIASMNKIFDDPGDNSTFHYLEASLHCCGITGPDSYHYDELPQSCCAEVLNVENECLLEDAYNVGCVEMIQFLIGGMKNNIKKLLFGVIAFQGLEIIGSIYLTVTIDARRKQAEAVHAARVVAVTSRYNKTQGV